MDIARDLESLNAALAPHRGRRVALVPTMGALHAGHRALLRAARGAADVVVASVFVNPLQFNNARDFERYPRDLEADANVLHEERCAVLWAPPEAVMYPEGFSVMVRAGGAAQEFEGAHRPGHFDGVATVIAKLFNQIRPDIAVFGEKDWQQLAVVRQLIKDLNFSLQVLGVPVERDAHGLALSSRNALLSEQGLAVARRLNAVLRTGGGEAELLAAGFEAVDYVGTLDGRTVAAAWVEGVRLIDAIATPAG